MTTDLPLYMPQPFKAENLAQVPRAAMTPTNLLLKRADGRSVLAIAVEYGGLSNLLGIDLPEEVKETVGGKWWAENQGIINQKKQVSEQVEASSDVELF